MHHLVGANITTQQGASMMIGIIDKAIEKVSSQRAALGAMMNTLERQADALQTTLTNTEAAKSKIVDTDYATETTIMAKRTILAQAGQQMLQLSKQIDSQTVMSLLQ
jgi:flagellin